MRAVKFIPGSFWRGTSECAYINWRFIMTKASSHCVTRSIANPTALTMRRSNGESTAADVEASAQPRCRRLKVIR